MARFCSSCADDIDDLPHYARMCKSCFAASKRREENAAQAEIARLREENAKLRATTTGAPKGTPALDATTLRQLIQLCHPDKHDGSSLANEITRKLLSMRGGKA